MTVTRKEAKERGLTLYSPGSTCKHGHVAERITLSGECTVCRKAKMANRNRSEEYALRRNPITRAEQRRYMKVWREEHRKGMREYHREYQRIRRSDPTVRKQDNADIRRRRNANPAAVQRNRDAAKVWARRNPEKHADISTRYKARKRLAFVEEVPRLEIFERDCWQCQLCKSPVDASQRVPQPSAPTIDHIVPLSKGGKHERKNLQTACYICNVRKGNRAADDQLLLVG